MTSFSYKFDVANADANTLGFVTLDDGNNTANAVTVVANRAGCPDGAATAIAWYDTTQPATQDQETQALVTGSVEGSGSYVDVGVLGKSAAASFSTVPRGLWARLYYLANGARRLSLYRFLPDDAASAVVRTVDLVTAGSIEVPRYRGLLTQAGALGAVQLVRVVATRTNAGYLLRCYLNTTSDDQPVLEALVSGDFTGTGDSNQPYGNWWMGFGPSGLAHGTSCAWLAGLDSDSSDDHAAQEVRADQVTLAEARRRVRSRYERGSASALSDQLIDDALRDAVEGLIEACGDAVPFLSREATVTLTPDASTGRVTLDPVMRRVISITEATSGVPMPWSVVAYGTSGALVLAFPCAAGSYLVQYVMRHRQPSRDTEPMPIPREFTEAMVNGACLRLAVSEGKTAMMQTFAALASAGQAQMQTSMARAMNQTKPVLAVPNFGRLFGAVGGWQPFGA